MRKIYSKIESNKLLHIHHSVTEYGLSADRKDLAPETEFLQVSHTVNRDAGTKYKPHKHKLQIRQTNRTQESWVVMVGSIKATLYDLDDTLLEEIILNEGDLIITLEGGHTYEVLEANTHILEFKTGPYNGQELDKEFI